jgi:hypothetical protein
MLMRKFLFCMVLVILAALVFQCLRGGITINLNVEQPASAGPDTPVSTDPSVSIATLTSIPTMTSQPMSTSTPTQELTAIANLCVAPPDGLVGWWPGNGNAQDMVTRSYGLPKGGISFEPGKVGQAFRFNGIDSSVDIPQTASLNLNKQVSIEFWMKPAEENTMDNCCQGLVGTDHYLVEVAGGWDNNNIAGVHFAINSNNFYTHTSDKPNRALKVEPGQWTFVVGTYDGNSLRLYINGHEEVQVNHRGDIMPMSSEGFLSIGSEDGRTRTACPDCPGNRYFEGLIDEVSIYDRALTNAEIQSIYSAGEAGKCRLPQ